MHKVLDLRFDSLEYLVENVQGWDLVFRQMEPNAFSGSVTQFVSQQVLLGHARFESGLDQMGSTPPGFRTFVLPGSSCRGFWWRGFEIHNNDLLIFPENNELRSVSKNDFEVFTISLHYDLVEQLSENLSIRPPGKREVIPLSSKDMASLRKQAYHLVESLITPDTQQRLHAFVQELLICSANGVEKTSSSLRIRDRAIDRVIDYLGDSRIPRDDLEMLCKVARVSERTLQYAFRERYGIPPKTFIKYWKLNNARRLLHRAQPGSLTVGEVCSRLGFNHASQFAIDYQRLFGELPSQTLKNSPSRFF